MRTGRVLPDAHVSTFRSSRPCTIHSSVNNDQVGIHFVTGPVVWLSGAAVMTLNDVVLVGIHGFGRLH